MKSPPLQGPRRSALDDFPGGAFPQMPSVTIVVPVLNEARYINQLAHDIINQDYACVQAIFFVDGCSTDGSYQALQALQGNDSRITILKNDRRLPAAAMNIAISRISSDLVIRLDAHAHYGLDVVSQCVSDLRSTGAGGVGALARPLSSTALVGQAIVAAHVSSLGAGIAKFRKREAEGWVDTVWNGCYWMHVVRAVGPLREDMPRAEDNDFNERVRRLGYGLYLSPRIAAYYRTRCTLIALWRQYFATGSATILAFPKNPRAFSLRHFIPLLFVSGTLFLLGIGLAQPHFMLPAIIFLSVYASMLCLSALVAARQNPGTHNLLVPAALMTLHFSHGAGSLWGIVQLLMGTLRTIRYSLMSRNFWRPTE